MTDRNEPATDTRERCGYGDELYLVFHDARAAAQKTTVMKPTCVALEAVAAQVLVDFTHWFAARCPNTMLTRADVAMYVDRFAAEHGIEFGTTEVQS